MRSLRKALPRPTEASLEVAHTIIWTVQHCASTVWLSLSEPTDKDSITTVDFDGSMTCDCVLRLCETLFLNPKVD